MRADGYFVALEGGDGAGKSTQARLLADALRGAGREVLLTRQPGGTRLGGQLRELVLHGDHMAPRAEVLLFAADKAQHVAEVIAPALAAGQVVITDRYVDSAVAYQGAARGLGADEVHRLQLWAVDDLIPDLTIVIDLPEAQGRQRRGVVHDRLESEDDAFHAAVRAHFVAMAHGNPLRYLLLDGMAAADQLHAAILQRLRADGVIT
ncbi:MAG: dTMP kinase [Tetrasphaera sp.]